MVRTSVKGEETWIFRAKQHGRLWVVALLCQRGYGRLTLLTPHVIIKNRD